MNKRASTSLTILILTFLFIILIVFAWWTFQVRENNVKIQISEIDLLEKTYAEESKVNVYINEIVTNAGQNTFVGGNVEQQFISNVKLELEKYKAGESYILPQLMQFENQLKEENVKVNGDSVSIIARLQIQESINQDGFEHLKIEYVYEKEFSSSLKVQ